MPAHKMKDGRWSVWLDLGSDVATGRRLRKKIEAQTKREAEVKAHAISERHARGENVMDTPRTLTQLLDDWLLTIEHEDKTANSLKTYRGACRNHLTPHLGAVDVPKLRARAIQKLFNELVSQLAPSTIQLIKTVLVSALNLAVEQNEISINPAAKIRIPSIKRTTGRSLSPEEVRAVLAVCTDHPYGLAIRLALMGLRRSELSGLRWTDFNEQTGTLLIARQMQRINKQWVAVKPKDDSGRLLTLGAKLTAALSTARADQAELRALMDWPDSGYIFVSQLNGGVCPPPTIYKAFKTISTRAGIQPARLHDCRHTAATALLASGEDIATVGDILGHASPHVTATIYAHALPHKVASASRRLEDLYDES